MIVVTGAKGLLGSEIMRFLQKNGIASVGLSREELDFRNENATDRLFDEIKPDIVIHCGAYSKVDKAQDNLNDCYEDNVQGTKNVVQACKRLDSILVFISTDYVFDGMKDGCYTETDEKNPLSVYGKTKSEAEEIVRKYLDKYYIIRTSWLFGFGGKNFVDTIIELTNDKKQISVVSDQIGSPTYTEDLTKKIFEVVKKCDYGIYHVTNSGACSWAEFARLIVSELGSKCEIKDIDTQTYGAKAPRPYNSRLCGEKLRANGIRELPSWEDAVKRYLKAK